MLIMEDGVCADVWDVCKLAAYGEAEGEAMQSEKQQ